MKILNKIIEYYISIKNYSPEHVFVDCEIYNELYDKFEYEKENYKYGEDLKFKGVDIIKLKNIIGAYTTL